jgi:CelD/BcsL family acetyltransferase involved in cellulose biosynthesis
MITTPTRQLISTENIVNIQVLQGFDDPSFSETEWMELMQTGDTDAVNLTWKWQRCWWQTYGKGDLLLILATINGKAVALAPLCVHDGIVFNLCPEDILDFVGNISDPKVLDAILITARDYSAQFCGFRFYFIPETSETANYLKEAAARLHLKCYEEESIPCPFLDIAGQPENALNMSRKKSLRRHENYFVREGILEVVSMNEDHAILPHLDEFFSQHILRRDKAGTPSIFLDQKVRDYYVTLTKELSSTGWLRFTRINWNGNPIAFHYGWIYKGRFLYGIASFDPALSAHSPGEVLLRKLLQAALEENAATFDFGIGDEAYKYRFTSGETKLVTWGLYPFEQ